MGNIFEKYVYYIYNIIIIFVEDVVIGTVDIVDNVITPCIIVRFGKIYFVYKLFKSLFINC